MSGQKMDFQKSLQRLLQQFTKESRPPRSGPGRPAKVRAEVQPVLLHLYREQVRWLDEYAEYLATLAEGNRRLSRVELVRGLLTALGEYAVRTGMTLPEKASIQSEEDLRRVVVEAMEQAGHRKRPARLPH